MRKIIIALTAAMALALAVPAVHAGEKAKPDATLSLTEGSVAAGIGFSWGKGTLTYQGKTYPVSVEGLAVGSVGITQATVAGKVFDLKDLKKFDGVYTAVSAGATAAGGGNVAVMRNQNGVRVELLSTTEGVSLTLASEGVKLQIKK